MVKNTLVKYTHTHTDDQLRLIRLVLTGLALSTCLYVARLVHTGMRETLFDGLIYILFIY